MDGLTTEQVDRFVDEGFVHLAGALQGLGTWPVRFPHDDDPGDAGWHVEGSIPVGDGVGLNVRSDGRALLLLFLFSDVGEHDAPTRVRVGSHRDVPRLLAPHGDTGAEFFAFAPDAATGHRPVMHATGTAGDVHLCHSFLVHSAQPHRGSDPKFMAQPPLMPTGRYDVAHGASPVERSMRESLP